MEFSVRPAFLAIFVSVTAFAEDARVTLLSRQLAGAKDARVRAQTVLLSIFAAVSLLLASIGIYGVLAYLVSQRTQEIGIRMARGAGPGDVLLAVAGEGMGLSIAGTAIGAAAAEHFQQVVDGAGEVQCLHQHVPHLPLVVPGARRQLPAVGFEEGCAAHALEAGAVQLQGGLQRRSAGPVGVRVVPHGLRGEAGDPQPTVK